MSSFKSDLIGQRFGKLSAVEYVGSIETHTGRVYGHWLCLCDCGNESTVPRYKLTQGQTECCGCEKQDFFSKHPIYSIYNAMRARCCNPSNLDYYNYGGRGIKVCERWLEPKGKGFLNFLEDMGERPDKSELDRVSPENDYEPSNCRWVDESLQAFNTRMSKKNTSGRTGVQWSKQRNKWVVSIGFNSERVYLGSTGIFEEACRIREQAELKYYGFVKQ